MLAIISYYINFKYSKICLTVNVFTSTKIQIFRKSDFLEKSTKYLRNLVAMKNVHALTKRIE